MNITLSSLPSEENQIQSYGRRLADELATEEAVDASLQKILRNRKRAGNLIWAGGGVILATFVWLAVAPAPKELGIGIALGAMLSAISALIKSELSSIARLHNPLASEGQLCAALRVLASHSPAVTAYIRSVTASGRQLRIFDVTRANVVYENEQYLSTRQQGEEACVALHSL